MSGFHISIWFWLVPCTFLSVFLVIKICFFTTAQTSLAVVFIPQFIFMFFMGHLKVGEVRVETTDAMLAPGSEQLYGGVEYNSTEPHQLYLLYMCTVGVQCCSARP